MRSSLPLARIRGIPLRVHVSLLLALPLLSPLFASQLHEAARGADATGGLPPLLWGLGVAVGLFATILLHELAHALYARARGARVEGITLMVVGGVTHLEEAPRRPRHEAVMALVGPLASLAIGALLLLAGRALAPGGWRAALLTLGGLNVGLALFNLLPAFPMDGGRVLRALLTPRLGVVRATRLSAHVGRGFAVLFAVLGLASANPMLLLVALFVFVAAGGEAQAAQAREVLGAMRVRELMRPSALPLTPGTPLEEALVRMRLERHAALPVAEGVRPVGVLALSALPQGAHGKPLAAAPGARVADVMVGPAPVAAPEDVAWDAVERMRAARVTLLAVVERGAWVGTLDAADVSAALQQARGGRRRLPPPERDPLPPPPHAGLRPRRGELPA
jgi:Zn-dependent protease